MKTIAALFILFLAAGFVTADDRPNIVWIVVDDMSSHFGYQGEKLVTTPHVDRLAKEGVVFSRAYATAPVCSTFRSAPVGRTGLCAGSSPAAIRSVQSAMYLTGKPFSPSMARLAM